MSIATLDGLLASLLPPEDLHKAEFTGEAAGELHSALYLAGRPGAGVAPSPGLAGAALASTGPTSPGYAGQIPFPAAVAGRNVHLAGIEACTAANIGAVILKDRLWHNSGIVVTTTGAQTINSVALPPRDADGAALGRGVQLGLEVSTVTGNGSPVTTITASYTNSDGVAGRTATITSLPTSAVAGTFAPFNLAAGDTGVRSVQSITLGTSLVSGAVHLVAYRKIVSVPTATSNRLARLGPAECGMPRLYDGSVPWLVLLLVGTAAGVTVGSLTWAQG